MGFFFMYNFVTIDEFRQGELYSSGGNDSVNDFSVKVLSKFCSHVETSDIL